DPVARPTNVVFMGMGEPLLNWPAVDAALSILNHPDGFGVGARHITVSTVGIVPQLAQLAPRPDPRAPPRADADRKEVRVDGGDRGVAAVSAAGDVRVRADRRAERWA